MQDDTDLLFMEQRKARKSERERERGVKKVKL